MVGQVMVHQPLYMCPIFMACFSCSFCSTIFLLDAGAMLSVASRYKSHETLLEYIRETPSNCLRMAVSTKSRLSWVFMAQSSRWPICKKAMGWAYKTGGGITLHTGYRIRPVLAWVFIYSCLESWGISSCRLFLRCPVSGGPNINSQHS